MNKNRETIKKVLFEALHGITFILFLFFIVLTFCFAFTRSYLNAGICFTLVIVLYAIYMKAFGRENPPSDELLNVSDAQKLFKSKITITDKKYVYRTINHSLNHKTSKIRFKGIISDEIKSELADKGYTVWSYIDIFGEPVTNVIL